MYAVYIIAILCLADWLYKILKILINFQIENILSYFSYISHLWRVNSILAALIIIICLIGTPKVFSKLRISSNGLIQALKLIIKKPIIINVPIYIYLSIIIFKLFTLIRILNLSNDNDQQTLADSTTESDTYWIQFRESFIIYRYSSLITMVLFLFGIYSIVTNRLARSIIKTILDATKKQIALVTKCLSITLPTPMSILVLLIINIGAHLFPKASCFIAGLLTSRNVLATTIGIICIYVLYSWLWPSTKFQLNSTGEIVLNDVSRLNETPVYSLFYPRTINDVEYLISKAKSEGRTISVRGQAHTMGGQTLPSRKRATKNYVCDLKYMNHVEYNEETKEVLVEAGATWTHVIKTLNFYGRSPVVMQSYCSFSVAGTISVNAHGITSDDAMYESVVSIEYIDMNGKRNECSRNQNSELFSLIIGGYGLFGIITRLKLRTVSNVKTSLEYLRLDSDRFDEYYEEFMNDSTVEIKIARVDLARPNNILMFIFRQESGTSGAVADLADDARVMNPQQHLVYTYVAQRSLFRRVRFTLEKIIGRPLDLTYSTDRNTTMYESAKPMALLYQPLAYYDDTFILQEYFIPKQYFRQWYDDLKNVLKKSYQYVILLNLTIRFVKRDKLTFLAYTKNNDCYAFVFYFRIKRNVFADQEIQSIHQELINLAFKYHGTFYLPYRQHYSREQIIQAYPMFDEFYQKKFFYDPVELFSNDWYEHYRPQVNYQKIENSSNDVDLITEPFQIVKQRRNDSFANVIHDEVLREKFRKFLHTVFNAEPVHVIFNYVNRAVRNPKNKNDSDIYRELQNVLKTRQFAFIRNTYALIKQILQLRLQITDLLRQQITIFQNLGYGGKIKDIVSIGDGGRCINQLRQILNIKDGRVYIINEKERLTDIIERNSHFSIGKFIPYNFKKLSDVPIPTESVDLVVCYMGLHHIPQDQLEIFLKMVYRILRPNGLFLFREHHAVEELKPLLDVAHMVFNVVTGVDYDGEINEIRAFRTIEQWRSCVRQYGFQDTFVYNEQDDDPTDDIMIASRKPPNENVETSDFNEIMRNKNFTKISAHLDSNYFRPCEWLVVRITMQFGQYLNTIPFYYFPFIKFLSIFWSLCFTEAQLAIKRYGIKQVLFISPSFSMNIFVGLFLTVSFIPLAFFSFLIRTIAGERMSPEYEQLVVEKLGNDNEDFNFQQSIDPSIDNVQQLKPNHLYAIRLPRHGVYTSILKKLALHSTKFNLLSISGQSELVQVEFVIHNNNERLIWLKQRPNMDIIFEYSNPVDQNQTHIILRVKLGYLFQLIRECVPFESDKSLSIVQIFDHFD